MLSRSDSELPDRPAALARFAVTLTAEPWAVTAASRDDLMAHGLDEADLEAAIGVVAMFNYLTRVADASGIDFDYASPLPRFEPRRQQEAVPRPDGSAWPVVGAEFRTFPRFPALSEAWQRWRGYLLDADEPLTRRQRGVLVRAAAVACCDRFRVDELAEYHPDGDAEIALADFAERLSLRPWRMRPTDLDGLRAAGHPEPALLHIISVVAHQNAESRAALGRAALS